MAHGRNVSVAFGDVEMPHHTVDKGECWVHAGGAIGVQAAESVQESQTWSTLSLNQSEWEREVGVVHVCGFIVPCQQTCGVSVQPRSGWSENT